MAFQTSYFNFIFRLQGLPNVRTHRTRRYLHSLNSHERSEFAESDSLQSAWFIPWKSKKWMTHNSKALNISQIIVVLVVWWLPDVLALLPKGKYTALYRGGSSDVVAPPFLDSDFTIHTVHREARVFFRNLLVVVCSPISSPCLKMLSASHQWWQQQAQWMPQGWSR